MLGYPLVAEGDFLPRPEDLERLVTPQTRAILVNGSSNPLRTVLPRELAQTLLDFARRHGLWFIADEVYDELTFDDAFVSVGSVTDLAHRLVSVLVLLQGLRHDRLARRLPGSPVRPVRTPYRDAGADRLVRQHPGPDGRPGRRNSDPNRS